MQYNDNNNILSKQFQKSNPNNGRNRDKTIPQTGIHMTFHPCIYMIFDTPGMAQALHTWHFAPLVWYRHFIHDLVHPCYGTGTSIQNDNAKLVLWVQTSPLSEMMRLFTYFPHMSTMPTLHITRWASLL